jgi:hypothetical protein
MLYEASVDIKSAQRFLGHADIEMTLAVYTHLTKFKEDEAINTLNAHMDKIATLEPQSSKSKTRNPKRIKKETISKDSLGKTGDLDSRDSLTTF